MTASATDSTTSSVHMPPAARTCGKEAINLAGLTGFTGLVLGAAHISWHQDVPAGYTVPRYLAARAGQAAALGGLYAAASCSYSQTFHADRAEGSAFGGFLSGAAIGLHYRSLQMAVGLGAAGALAGFFYEFNDRSFRGPIGNMEREARNKWSQDSFWKNPSQSPVARALEVADKARADN
ncbi:hypothetical protein BCR44DRAFT_1459851 [Catenaria anguillulae PL171]|uniref:Uncharacterized protein n=1 Tax=Catenaria anguillulae PL171 TaxID=765915 RepID=A0A1Y2HRS0_9FUNG|nr:hypothetical protein BCR44DRAFT_1459851 [Catenaria anguillulae PL171]